jgi:predicted nucleic acid-binding protein
MTASNRMTKAPTTTAAAVNAGANLIVSGDNDPLTVGSYQAVRVVTARNDIDGLHFPVH